MIVVALEGQTSFWQAGYGFVQRQSEHILNQEERQKSESFQEEYLRLLKKDKVFARPTVLVRVTGLPFQGEERKGKRSGGVATVYDGPALPGCSVAGLQCPFRRWRLQRPSSFLLEGASAENVQIPVLVTKSHQKPERETQLRPLLALSLEQAQQAWDHAVKNAGGRRITARLVKKAGDKRSRLPCPSL